VIFAGGEPTLLGEELLDALAYLDQQGIFTRIVTNAFWAETPASAKAMVNDLREAGLHEINISTDEFHLPFIPIKSVRNAWEACKRQGFESVIIALASGPGSTFRPDDLFACLGEQLPLMFSPDGRGRPLPAPADDGTVYAVANNDVYRIGRGRRLPLRHVRSVELDELSSPCPWAIRSAAISPKGHLVACCGIEAEDNEVLDFGDTQEESIDSLIEKANSDEIVAAIASLGPLYLMRRALEIDATLKFRTNYAAICEICEDVVTNPAVVKALRGDSSLRSDVITARLLSKVRATTEAASL
jgi:MoaA/NifB/PqqE/SkfB family radical SAM enzyme